MEEKRAEFLELQRKLQDTRAQLQTVERQGMAYANEMRRAGLVAAELQDLPEDTSVYRSVGKAFLSTSRNAALTEVEESRAEASKRIESLKATAERLSKEAASAEADIKELAKDLTA